MKINRVLEYNKYYDHRESSYKGDLKQRKQTINNENITFSEVLKNIEKNKEKNTYR